MNWASQVKSLLSMLCYYAVWLAQGVSDVQIFLNEFRQSLKDTFIQDLNECSRIKQGFVLQTHFQLQFQ